jgi:hypothetical protein
VGLLPAVLFGGAWHGCARAVRDAAARARHDGVVAGRHGCTAAAYGQWSRARMAVLEHGGADWRRRMGKGSRSCGG